MQARNRAQSRKTSVNWRMPASDSGHSLFLAVLNWGTALFVVSVCCERLLRAFGVSSLSEACTLF